MSCNLVVMKMYKMSNPRFESLSKQKEFLNKSGLDTNNLFMFNGDMSARFRNQEFSLYLSDSSGFKPIQTRVFDKSHSNILNWASCYGPIDQYLNKKEINPIYPDLDSSLSLKALEELVISREKFNNLVEDNNKMVFVSFWAKYLGVFSTDRLRYIDDLCKKEPLKYVHIKINIGDLR